MGLQVDMCRQVGFQLFIDTDGTIPGAAAMRDRKCLMQVEVTDIRADQAGLVNPTWAFMLAHPYTQTAIIVNNPADIFDRFFENA